MPAKAGASACLIPSRVLVRKKAAMTGCWHRYRVK
jgi:hypothetical protein